MNLHERITRLEQRARRSGAPPWQEVVAAIGRGARKARARLTGETVDEADARRDGDLLERWRRSQGIAPEVIAQEAEEARARLLEGW